jgi:hypothetical protein
MLDWRGWIGWWWVGLVWLRGLVDLDWRVELEVPVVAGIYKCIFEVSIARL